MVVLGARGSGTVLYVLCGTAASLAESSSPQGGGISLSEDATFARQRLPPHWTVAKMTVYSLTEQKTTTVYSLLRTVALLTFLTEPPCHRRPFRR